MLLLVPKENKDAIRWIANIFALGGFLISLPLVPMFWAQRFERHATFKFIEGAPNNWIPTIGAGYFLGIDGISFLLIMLTTLLGWISILCSWVAIENRVKEYYVWFLVLQTGMLGVFMALDFFLFFVFWEAMLVPMYLLIGIWGGPRKLYAAIKFFLYTLAGSVLMLLGMLFLYFNHHTSPASTHSPFPICTRRRRRSSSTRLTVQPTRPCFSSASSLHSPSRFRCSPSIPGSRTRTSKRLPRVR